MIGVFCSIASNLSPATNAFRKELSKEAKGLIKGMLTVDPSKRVTAKQAEEMKFFSGADARGALGDGRAAQVV